MTIHPDPKTRRTSFARRLAGSLAAVLLVAAAQSAAGAYLPPLGLTQQNPDITVDNLSLSQVGGASFTATGPGGVANFTDAAGVSGPILYGSYSLSLNLTGGGPLGSLSILDPFSNPLLVGDLTAYGASDDGGGNGTFEFLLDITASDPALGFGSRGGIILSASQLTGPTGAPIVAFDDTTTFTGIGRSDNFNVPVPEPGTLLLGALGILGLLSRRRRG